jgi:transcriptional regulator with XRE-family HTH domain
MSEPRGAELPALGARIRSERLRRGLTVRGLARDIGVSASLISQIETERSRPSVSTLYAITAALGISVEELFDPEEPGARADSDAESPSDAPSDARSDALSDADAQPDDVPDASADGQDAAPTMQSTSQTTRLTRPMNRQRPRVRPPERERLTLDSGVTWERLGQHPDAHFDFLLVTYAPGGTSSSSGELMRHHGTEYGYLVSGELVLTLGSEDHAVAAGESVCFDSSTPHRLRNDGDTPAVGVWFVVERG